MNRNRTRNSPWRVVALMLLLATPARAQEPKGSEASSSWLPILNQQAADYEIAPRGESKATPRPLPEPILRWTQPVRGGDDGAVFLWVADGRPAAVGTIFTYRVPGSPRAMQHEVHSLMPTGLDATWRGRPMWKSDKPGLEFLPLPDAPAPAESPAARTRQMQAIAREFTADSVHEKAGRNELRLMPRPLHRYGPTPDGLIDGAMFCFAHGTDPEAFLFIEARRNGTAASWRYAFARFSDLPLHARHKGVAVWEVPTGRWNSHDGVHAYYLVERADADTPEEYEKAPKLP